MAKELKPLTGLRFAACLVVFASHLPDWGQPDHPLFAATAGLVIEQAYIAMPFFFMLSGFVLSHVYADRIVAAGRRRLDRTVAIDFLAGRLARLYPLQILCVLLIVPWALAMGRLEAGPLVAQLTLTNALFPDARIYGGLNAPSWAMSAELVFSLSFPALALFLAPLGPRLRLPLLATALAAPLLVAGAIVAADIGTGFFALYINPFARLAEFCAGMLLHSLWRQLDWRPQGLRWELLAVAFCLASMVLTRDLPAPYRYWPAFMPAALFAIAVFAEGTGPLARFFASDALRALGRLSFAFYLVHYAVIRYAEWTALARVPADDPLRWAIAPLLVLLSLGCAFCIHHGVELAVQPRLRRALVRLAAARADHV